MPFLKQNYGCHCIGHCIDRWRFTQTDENVPETYLYSPLMGL